MTTRTNSKAGWIVSPAFDLCFIINIWWLAVAFLSESTVAATQQSSLTFWQVYFITTPHRWITLLLVATDPDKRQGRTYYFLFLAVAAAMIVGGVRWTVGGFTCLMAIDYIWNAWHFGAQHGGILRIFSLKSGGGGSRGLELNTMRFFPAYVSVRLVAELNGWLEVTPAALAVIQVLDVLFLLFPMILVGKELLHSPAQRPGKVLYLLNVCAMYAAMLVCLRTGRHTQLIMLTVANAMFHAVEYLAIVTFYAWKRQEQGSASPFQSMARDWLRVLATYIVLLGVVSNLLDNSRYEFVVQLFIGANLWAAYLHYAFDGMIWKLRRPQTAQTLGLERSSVNIRRRRSHWLGE
jgi:hypothetical protein